MFSELQGNEGVEYILKPHSSCPQGNSLRVMFEAVSTAFYRSKGFPDQAGRLKNGAVSNTGFGKLWPSLFRLRFSTKS